MRALAKEPGDRQPNVRRFVEELTGTGTGIDSGQVSHLRGGGDGLGFIISLLMIVLLVVVILQVSGHKIII